MNSAVAAARQFPGGLLRAFLRLGNLSEREGAVAVLDSSWAHRRRFFLRRATMETALQLLMRDGAVQISFHPRLTPDEYAELITLVEQATTKDELSHAVRQAAQRWGKEHRFDELGV